MADSLKNILKGKIVLVGIGNILKSDDAVGPALIEKLNGKINAVCLDAATAPENYSGKIIKEEPDTILIIDAVHLNLDPGEYRILDPDEILKTGFTTHDISPNLFIEYLQSQTKADIYMLGIQPQCLDLGGELSGEVKKTLNELTKIIQGQLNRGGE